MRVPELRVNKKEIAALKAEGHCPGHTNEGTVLSARHQVKLETEDVLTRIPLALLVSYDKEGVQYRQLREAERKGNDEK